MGLPCGGLHACSHNRRLVGHCSRVPSSLELSKLCRVYWWEACGDPESRQLWVTVLQLQRDIFYCPLGSCRCKIFLLHHRGCSYGRTSDAGTLLQGAETWWGPFQVLPFPTNRVFNYKLSWTRLTVDNTFGILAAQWWCTGVSLLSALPMRKPVFYTSSCGEGWLWGTC